MADYLIEGNKTIRCIYCESDITIPFQTTVTKCSNCGRNIAVKFFGVLIKNGEYIY